MKNVEKKFRKEKIVEKKRIKEGKILQYLTWVLLWALVLNSFVLVTIKFVDLKSVFTSVVSFSQTISAEGEPIPPAPEPTPLPIPTPSSSGNGGGGGSVGIFEIFPPSTNQIPSKNGPPAKELLPSKQPFTTEPSGETQHPAASPETTSRDESISPSGIGLSSALPIGDQKLGFSGALSSDSPQKTSSTTSSVNQNPSAEEIKTDKTSPEISPQLGFSQAESKKLLETTLKIFTMEEAIFFLLGIEIILIVALLISTLMLYRKKLRH